jgi:two-component system chemotaxis response regulator CheB
MLDVPRRMVGLAASSGGSLAVAAILARLPRDFPACIAVVQHLPVGFAERYADWLASGCRLRVELVRGRVPIRPATVYVAGDDRHLAAVVGEGLRPTAAAPIGGHRPAATVLFQSLAEAFGAHAIGVVLSGMGDDGAPGLLSMRARGALTIAQDAATSAVFGMPRAAIEAGAIVDVLPLEAIPAALCRACTMRRVLTP